MVASLVFKITRHNKARRSKIPQKGDAEQYQERGEEGCEALSQALTAERRGGGEMASIMHPMQTPN